MAKLGLKARTVPRVEAASRGREDAPDVAARDGPKDAGGSENLQSVAPRPLACTEGDVHICPCGGWSVEGSLKARGRGGKG